MIDDVFEQNLLKLLVSLQNRNSSSTIFFDNLYRFLLENSKTFNDEQRKNIKNNLSGILKYGDFNQNEYNLIVELYDAV